MKPCRYHCRGYPFGGCDAHFSSLEAFDQHRQGPFDGERHCVDPEDVGLVSVEGRCKHQRPPVDAIVQIWGLPVSAAEQERLERLSATTGTA